MNGMNGIFPNSANWAGMNEFDDFYVSNKRKAGTYVFMNGQWVFT